MMPTIRKICITHSQIILIIPVLQWYLDYWVGVWWVKPTIRYRIQNISFASAKITPNNGITA